MTRKLWLVSVLSVSAIMLAAGCSRGGTYKIMKAESMSGQRIVAAMVDGGVTDETLKTWGKEISDQQGAKEPVTVMFYSGKDKLRATYAAGYLMSMPEGGVTLPSSPPK